MSTISRIKDRVKQIPFLGDVLFMVKSTPRYIICSVNNRWYYFMHNNFPQPGAKYVITDEPSLGNKRGILEILKYRRPGDTLSDLPSGGAFMDTDRRGFFSIIIAILDEVSADSEKNIEIRLNHTMFNDSPDDNMWDYYFEPIQNSDNKSRYKPSFNLRPHRDSLSCENTKHAELFNKVIKDKIKIKDDILEKIDAFENKHFKNKKIIGVHCRGSNLMLSISSVSHLFRRAYIEEYFREIDLLLEKGYDGIFLATDDERLFKKFTERYGDKIVHYSQKRSNSDAVICHYARDKYGKPIGDINFTPRELGEEVLIDGLLLSKSDFLICGSSNVTTVTKYFNPSIPYINLELKYKSPVMQTIYSIGLA